MGQPLSSKFHLVGCELVRAIRDVYPTRSHHLRDPFRDLTRSVRLSTFSHYLLPDPFKHLTRPVWHDHPIRCREECRKNTKTHPQNASENGSLYGKRAYDLDRASRNALIQSGERHTSAS